MSRVWSVLMVALMLVSPGRLLAQNAEAPNRIRALAWSPDGSMMAVATEGGSIALLEPEGTTWHRQVDVGNPVYAAAFSPDGTSLAVANGPEVQIWQHSWDTSSVEYITTISLDPIQSVSSLAWSPDGNKIAVASHFLEVWDIVVSPMARLFRQNDYSLWITQVAWSPSGTLLATSGVDYTVKIWDATTGNVVSTMRVMTNPVTSFPSELFSFALSVSWGPDDLQLVFGAEDGTVRVWDRTVSTDTEIVSEHGHPGVWFGHDGAVVSVDWHPTRPLIASGGIDDTVRIWNAHTGEQLQVIRANTHINVVAWSPDGTQLAYGIEDGAVTIVPAPKE